MKKLFFPTLIIFLLLASAGIFLAWYRPLWTDELFTQLNMEHLNFFSILTGDMKEGNCCPLFYVNQKIFISAIHYHFPIPWENEFSIYEPASQILIRLPDVIYMSLGLTIIFFVFARFYSLGTGLFALALSLSNPMVYMYWAEARPYGLWFLLTTIQAALLLQCLRNKNTRHWFLLGLCHILLALTIMFSLPQIFLVSTLVGILWKMNWRKMLWVFLFPFGIVYAYYILSKNIYSWLPTNILGNAPCSTGHSLTISASVAFQSFFSLIVSNIPWVWLSIIGLYLLFLIGKAAFKKKFDAAKEAVIFLICTLALLTCAAAIVFLFNIWKSSGMTILSTAPRYIMFLIPYALFFIVLSGWDFLNSIKDPLLRAIILTIYAGTIIVSILNTASYLLARGFY